MQPLTDASSQKYAALNVGSEGEKSLIYERGRNTAWIQSDDKTVPDDLSGDIERENTEYPSPEVAYGVLVRAFPHLFEEGEMKNSYRPLEERVEEELDGEKLTEEELKEIWETVPDNPPAYGEGV
ncbi:MAG: hypothetical protein ABEJ62_01180 [Candidatus Nanohaloarchaea archaeon]